MKQEKKYSTYQLGFTLMELLVSIVISSIVFMGISFVIVKISRHQSYESIKLDSKVFANYVLDDIENTIVKGSSISIEPGIYSGIDEITVTLIDGNVIYAGHARHGISRSDKKIYNYDNTYDNGGTKFSINEMRCYKPTNDTFNPLMPASSNILDASFVLELEISIYDSAGEPLESYLMDRYIFNPYIYSTSS